MPFAQTIQTTIHADQDYDFNIVVSDEEYSLTYNDLNPGGIPVTKIDFASRAEMEAVGQALVAAARR